jgi:sensor histidine kinase YesM
VQHKEQLNVDRDRTKIDKSQWLQETRHTRAHAHHTFQCKIYINYLVVLILSRSSHSIPCVFMVTNPSRLFLPYHITVQSFPVYFIRSLQHLPFPAVHILFLFFQLSVFFFFFPVHHIWFHSQNIHRRFCNLFLYFPMCLSLTYVSCFVFLSPLSPTVAVQSVSIHPTNSVLLRARPVSDMHIHYIHYIHYMPHDNSISFKYTHALSKLIALYVAWMLSDSNCVAIHPAAC